MRVLRFSQTLGFDIEDKTADSVRRSYRCLPTFRSSGYSPSC